MTYHLLSYPRSGNHMVRTLLEYGFGRPTLGCFESRRDTPIYQREPNRRTGLIQITNEAPIGYKSHFILETIKAEMAYGEIPGLAIIVRDPVAAIASHTCRSIKGLTAFKPKEIRRKVEHGLNSYMALVHYFRSRPAERKLVVEFERLLDPDTQLDYANGLLRRLDCETRLDRDQLDRLLVVSKDSQETLRKNRPALMADMRAQVAAAVSYAEVKDLLYDVGVGAQMASSETRSKLRMAT
ncbi:hypothetical protein [Aquicoccus sp. SU-CL01552]|uniref:hypothetical protein n=1 Tax=Aquicoccus sp. SU-CL01552 TaxID=3127656 RepID=UPI003108B380